MSNPSFYVLRSNISDSSILQINVDGVTTLGIFPSRDHAEEVLAVLGYEDTHHVAEADLHFNFK